MTYEEALTYLEDTSSFGIKPGLERIRALLQALGILNEIIKSFMLRVQMVKVL